MKIPTFRILLTVSWVSLIAFSVVDYLLEPALAPEPSSNAVAMEYAAADLAWVLVGLIWWIAYIASCVGLSRLRRWGRTMFVWTVAIVFPMNLLWPPPPLSPAIGELFGAWYILVGFLLATVYFVPSISERFEAPDPTAHPFD